MIICSIKSKRNKGVYQIKKNTASKADTIAHATKKIITEKMEEYPAFYEIFSMLIQRAIEDFRAKRISDLEYLNRVIDIRNKVVNKIHDDIPESLNGNEAAMAFYGILKPFLEQQDINDDDLERIVANASIAIHTILNANRKVNFWDDDDAQKQVFNEIDDYLYDDIKGKEKIELSMDQMDLMIEKVLQIAKIRNSR